MIRSVANKEFFSRGNDASGFTPEPFVGADNEFSEITVIHRSTRHIVLKAKRNNRWWILKGLSKEIDSQANRAALRKEFEIMMQLPYDGFAQAFALEDVTGYGICIVMSYVEGPTLAEWIDASRSRSERTKMALKLIDAVERLHAAGIVSRDIKPANIIVNRISQMPTMIDFDLADTDAHTAFKAPGGTPGYISPEQASGSMPDRRNDIFSLGKIFQQMRLPLVWRPAIRRCLRAIDKRPPDAASIRSQVARTRNAMRYSCIALALSAICFTMWKMSAIGVIGQSQPPSYPTAPARSYTAPPDSASLSLTPAAAIPQQSGLSASPSPLPAESSLSDLSARKKAIEAMSRKWCKKMDIVYKTDIRAYLDTVAGPPDYNRIGNTLQSIYAMMESMRSDLAARGFSKEEIAEVNEAMIIEYSRIANSITQ